MSCSISVMMALAVAIRRRPRGGVDPLGAMVVGIRDALEVAALFEVVEQRFHRLLAHRGVSLDYR
jgi:hypothetical protein